MRLLGVFDAVGGRNKGRLVAHLAATTIATAWHTLSAAEQQFSLEQCEAHLQTVLRQADAVVASCALPNEDRSPATTAALGVLSMQQGKPYVSLAHIGDSRVYLLRAEQGLQRLTEDHGYFPYAVRKKRLTWEESVRIEQAAHASELSSYDLDHFARRNQITCVVGWADFPHIPTRSLPLEPGDHLVFCTDGIHDNLTDQEITNILREAEEREAFSLVTAAYDRSQQTHLRAKADDLSAIVVTVRQ